MIHSELTKNYRDDDDNDHDDDDEYDVSLGWMEIIPCSNNCNKDNGFFQYNDANVWYITYWFKCNIMTGYVCHKKIYNISLSVMFYYACDIA